MYTRKQVLIYCILSVIIAIVLIFIFRISPFYWKVRSAVGGSGLKSLSKRASLADPDNAQLVREGYSRIIAQRDLLVPKELQTEITTIFHRLRIWDNMYYLGIKILKNPCDLWVMQQISYDIKPDYIIEAGTADGGSALYFAHILEGMGLHNSKVITIDIFDRTQAVSKLPLWKKMVEFMHGSSTDSAIVEKIRRRVKGKKVIVVLDSNHSRDHVFKELLSYGPIVSPGSYLVVEDTMIDGIPVAPDYGPGPMSAAIDFLKTEQGANFTQDVTREAMILTFNPGGWLRKKQ
jgi:cephalosporin hydroxylase